MAQQSIKKALAKTIGANARVAREALGWSRDEAASRLHISYEYYARIERGHSLPGLQTFLRLVTTLRTRADFLLGAVMSDASDPADETLSAEELYIASFARENPKSIRLIMALIREIERAGSHED